jgi:hypothetical protein
MVLIMQGGFLIDVGVHFIAGLRLVYSSLLSWVHDLDLVLSLWYTKSLNSEVNDLMPVKRLQHKEEALSVTEASACVEGFFSPLHLYASSN